MLFVGSKFLKNVESVRLSECVMEINVECNIGEGEGHQNVENVALFADFVGVEVSFD